MSNKGGYGRGVSGACLGILVAHVENNENMMIFGSPNVIDTDVGIPVVFSGTSSVNFGSSNVFDADVESTIVFVRSTNGFDADVVCTVAFSGSTSANFGSPYDFDTDDGSAIVCSGSLCIY